MSHARVSVPLDLAPCRTRASNFAIFPAGTWWLHRFAGVKCADVGATAPPS